MLSAQSLWIYGCINEELDEESKNPSFPKTGTGKNILSELRTVKFDSNLHKSIIDKASGK